MRREVDVCGAVDLRDETVEAQTLASEKARYRQLVAPGRTSRLRITIGGWRRVNPLAVGAEREREIVRERGARGSFHFE